MDSTSTGTQNKQTDGQTDAVADAVAVAFSVQPMPRSARNETALWQ